MAVVRKCGPSLAPAIGVGGAAAQGPSTSLVAGAAPSLELDGRCTMALEEPEVRISAVEDEIAALKREVEFLREEVRALASVVGERLPAAEA